MIDQKGHIHFIAIGGSAMHNLAIALKQSGYFITGSDDDIFEPSKSRLLKHGLLPEKLGWHPKKLSHSTQAVILGMHARNDNPELKKAIDLGLKIYSFPDFVYEASKSAKRVVIAGSHGKTTITSIIMHVLNYHHKKFDYLVGAGLKGFDNMVKLSNAPVAVLEGDEYLSSTLDKTPKFIRYNHNIGLISGISWDHINAFPTRDQYVEQFEKFMDNTPDDGHLIYFSEDENLKALVDKKDRNFNLIPYSTPSYKVRDNAYFLNTDNNNLIPVKLFGKHNMQNLAGAKKVLQLLGLEENDIFAAFETFQGASNRLERIFESGEILVYKDFAHSPSKLKSTGEAIIESYPDRRIVSCFELHTYSSLNKDFLQEYRNSFPKSELRIVFVNDHTFKIKKMPPLSDDQIKNGFNDADLTIIRTLPHLKNILKMNIRSNTVFLFMSSGNFGGFDYSDFTKSITQYLAK
jgi:UDP-N-acetylmuramate: L-alanyl-gamma-D-glutamyl-meso-diaminopimelate ligase